MSFYPRHACRWPSNLVRLIAILSVPALAAGCQHNPGVEPTPRAAGASSAPSAPTSPASDDTATGPTNRGAPRSENGHGPQHGRAQPAPMAAGRLKLDMIESFSLAETRVDDEIAIALGALGAGKYDAGGWLSGTSGLARVAGEAATWVKGKKARLWLPADSGLGKTLRIRLRTARPDQLTLYVNGETVGHAKPTGKRYQWVQAVIPAGLLHAGDNEVQIRVQRTGPMDGVGHAGMALTDMRLQASDASSERVDLPRVGQRTVDDGSAPRPLPRDRAAAQAPYIELPTNTSVGYGYQVGPGDRLRARVATPAVGTLEVHALVDGQPSQRLGRIEPGHPRPAIDLDLAKFAGQFVELRLTARDGDVQVNSPRIVSTTASGDALTTATGAADTTTAAQRPENIIIVLIDTLRADKLSPYNRHTRVKTPGLQLFLRDSAVMLNARTQENWTKPSVATLLSSLLPWEHHAVTGEAKVPRSVELLPEVLKRRGYYTGAFIANGYVSDKFGFKQGLDVYRNYIREGRKAKAQFVAADVLEFLDKRPKDKPFFLYMHTIDPHVPYKPPGSFLAEYDSDPYSGPVDFRRSSTLLEKVKMGKLKLGKRDKRRLEALYNAEISYHDVHFAAMLRGLERRGLDKNTVVVVTADHGEEFWDHGSVGHGHSVYDELLHVPMVVRIPGVTHGAQRLSEAVGLVDVMPTVLEATGQTVPAQLSGQSFLPELNGTASTTPRIAVSGFMDAYRTVAQGTMKLIQRTRRQTRLFNTATDPHEKHDLLATHPIAIRHLRGRLGLELARKRPRRTKSRSRSRRHRQESVKIDAETKAQLEALGYVGGQPH